MNVLDGYTLDTSNYDDPTFDAACFAANGVKRIIVGAQYEAIANKQVAQAKAAGINVMGVYAFLYFGGGQQAADATRRAIRVAKNHAVPVIWLDAEADMPGVTVTSAQRNAELDRCVSIVKSEGLTPGIYTGGWWWTPKHATTVFNHLPLWFSLYGANDGKQKPVRNPGFGGWQTAAIHQYTSNVGLCGRDQRDFNHVWPDAPGLEKEDEVTREEYEALVDRVNAIEDILTGGDEAGLAEAKRWLANGNSLLLGYAGEQQKLGAHLASPHGGGGGNGIPPHRHEMNVAIATTGPVVGGGE